MEIELLTGVARRADDMTSKARGGSQGELVVGELNGKYYEQIMRGNGFVYSQAAAGVAPIALAATSSPIIWNPSDSNTFLQLIAVKIGLVTVGTPVAGMFEYTFQNNMGASIGTGAPVVSLTQVAGVNLRLSGGKASVMRFAPATITLTTANTFLCPVGLSMATAATTAIAPFGGFKDDVDGMIVVPPGSTFGVAANAALGSTYCISIFGLELPIPLIV